MVIRWHQLARAKTSVCNKDVEWILFVPWRKEAGCKITKLPNFPSWWWKSPRYSCRASSTCKKFEWISWWAAWWLTCKLIDFMLLLTFWGDSVVAKVVAFHLKRYGFESHSRPNFFDFLQNFLFTKFFNIYLLEQWWLTKKCSKHRQISQWPQRINE